MLANSDLLIIGAPHRSYRELVTDLPVADVWNLLGRAPSYEHRSAARAERIQR